MKQEFALLRAGRLDRAEPVPFQQNRQDFSPLRRMMRESSDGLIQDGLMANGVPPFAWRVVRLMLDTASALDTLGLEPELDDFVGAAISMVQYSRDTFDRGLQIHDATTVNVSAVCLEIIIHGLCSVLSLSYDELLPLVHSGDHEAFREYMRSKGHISEREDSGEAVGDHGAADHG